MTAVRRLTRIFSSGQPGGMSRLAALCFFVLALVGAGVTLAEPQIARWAGAALLAAIGILALLILISAWPQNVEPKEENSRAASAAAASNVAWAVTSKEGSVLDCNAAYRALAAAGEGDPAAPPNLAFSGKGPAAALYRLSRSANDGGEREESFETDSGQKLTVSVKPLKNGESAWWLTSRTGDTVPAKGIVPEARVASALIRFSDFFRNAPVGVAITTAGGDVIEANGAFTEFFALGTFAAGAKFGELVALNERSAALDLIARAAAGEASHEPAEIHCASGPKAIDRSAQLFASP